MKPSEKRREKKQVKIKLGDGQRRSIPNLQPGMRGKFQATAMSMRRVSMFARNYHPAIEGEGKVEVTFIPPLLRFRRAARVIRILSSVCLACKKNMTFSVAQNNWVALKEALLRESDVSKDQNKEKKKAALTTDDPELTFDLSKFRRQSKDVDVMPVKIKDLLRKRPGDRTPEEVLNIMRTMQKMEIFARFPLSIQRRLCECAWLQTVEPNRVLLRSGHVGQSVYYVISGRLVANGEEETGHMVTTLLKRGDKFGEEEIISKSKRAATVMSQDTAELFVVYGDDYKDICFAKGSKDISSLSICRKNPVFHHWPLQKLIENPGSWTMQNYKPGTLIVEDSGRCDWVYIIKSGQCKVVKCLKPGEPEEDPARIKKLLARHARQKLLKEIETKNLENDIDVSEPSEDRISAVPPSSTFFTTPLSRPQTHGYYDEAATAAIQEAMRQRSQTPMKRSPFLVSLYGPKVNRPVYVALEVLGVGDSFGFLAVLPKDQRGSSVSLISCGSEVIQINKKFFQKFADETVYSLINMKFPPFPKQHEILQNLRQSFMWKDYKRQTLDDALAHLYRPVVQSDHKDQTIAL
ncbi:cyclic nucleotide-binding domain-containing protein 2-like isoform X3 [Styela clava]